MSTEVINCDRLGVMSDTHGSLNGWSFAVDAIGPVGAMLHAGDVLYHGPRNPIPEWYQPSDLGSAIKNYKGMLLVSRGNCDAPVDEMVTNMEFHPWVSLVWNDRKIIMMHGDNIPLLHALAHEGQADLVISGHTHVPSLEREEGMIFLNPGSTTLPKGGSRASAAVIDDKAVTVLTLDGDVLYSEKW